jgi:hypothetical protein
MNGWLRFALGLANMPDHTVADLEQSLPGFSRLVIAAKQLQPIIQKAMPHVIALEPLVQEALPIIKASYPDIVAVTPTVQELILFIQGKGTKTP